MPVGAMPRATVRSKELWLEDRLHELKHTDDYSQRLLREFKTISKECKSSARRERVEASVKYFTNNKNRMLYADQVRRNGPIGSGVTEAACKTVVKQRLCVSGASWSESGASVVLSLRTFVLAPGHWNSFWEKVVRYGSVT